MHDNKFVFKIYRNYILKHFIKKAYLFAGMVKSDFNPNKSLWVQDQPGLYSRLPDCQGQRDFVSKQPPIPNFEITFVFLIDFRKSIKMTMTEDGGW